MYRVLCDGYVLHDSNIEKFSLVNPTLNIEVNKSGEFSFQITKNHVYYDKIKNKKSYIEIYEDGVFLWGGRPIKINTGIKLIKKVTCEGELSFLHDSNQRLAEYHNTSVSDYLKIIIQKHNADVDESKQFTVGNVTVEDNNDSLYRYSNYEDTFDTIKNKLISRLGGYILIRHENGVRYIDYLKEYPYISNQVIQIGSNIIDISLDENCTDTISAIIPLGAKMSKINGEISTEGENKAEKRLTIESVNDGVDYIFNQDAVDRLGMIKDTVIFEDVELASNLMRKGYEELISRIYGTLTIPISVFDKGFIEKNIDRFRLGCKVVVDSPKHGLDNIQTMISKMNISLVDVTKWKIEIGISKKTLTSNITDTNNKFDTKVENIVSNYITNEEVTVINPKLSEVYSKIDQTANSIKSEVASKYLVATEKEAIYAYIKSMVEQSESDITMTFRQDISNIENTVNINQQNLEKYIRFSIDGIELGDVDSPFKTNIDNTEIFFSQNGQKIAYISNSKLYILEAEFINKITVGSVEKGYYDILVRSDKHWTMKYRKESE